MRLVFAGTPQSAVPSLEALLGAGRVPLAVLTQPDRRRGRGRQLLPSPVAVVAQERGLELLQPERASDPDFLNSLEALRPDLVVVVAYGQIFTRRFLEIPVHGAINLHFSLLPAHRGASPVQAAILAGRELTGVTIFRLVDRLDAGPTLVRHEIPILPGENAGDLENRLAQIGASLVVESVCSLEGGTAEWTPQDEAQATICRKLEKQDGRIDWALPGESIVRQVRAMTPWPGAFTELVRGERPEALRVIVQGCVLEGGPLSEGEPGGTILAHCEGVLQVATGSGVVRIARLQPSGKRMMDVDDFVRGHPVAPGDRFS